MRKFKESHKNCHSSPSTITRSGTGLECPISEEGYPESDKDCSCKNSCENNSNVEGQNQIIIGQEPSVPITNDQQHTTDTIPDSLIIEKSTWRRHHKKAKMLLDKLKESKEFTIDQFSIVSVNGVSLQTSVFDLFKLCYQSNFHKIVPHLNLFTDLIKKINATSLISNKALFLHNEVVEGGSKSDWFFIGM